MFPLKPPSNYNLRNQQEFTVNQQKLLYGLNFLAYLGPRIWELLPNNLKRLESVEAFKSKIKGWNLKTDHAESVNHTSTKRALYRFISIGFNLFIFYLINFFNVIG